jgi:histone-lysine N-methyltransferase SETMAR
MPLRVRVNYLKKGVTIKSKHYGEFHDRLKQQLVSKWRGKLSKETSFLRDSAAPHKAAIAHHKLADFHFEVLKHPAYSPDLAPSNCYLFPDLKKHLNGRKFSNTDSTTLALDGWLAAQTKEFILDGLKKLEQQILNCLEFRGEYVE